MKPKVLLLADECNPEWPSLPIVGYKYAQEIARLCDVTLATHVRNRENIEKQAHGLDIRYIDTEWLAGPMFRLARWLRGGEEVAWSTSMIMNYLPYLAFEHGVYRALRGEFAQFDIVHRITPMSPTLPSWIAHKCRQPFVIGPLNGNLDWPAAFAAEQAREKEKLRKLRDLYKYLPYARSTYDDAEAVLSAFSHTRADLTRVPDARIVSMPEIGFDPAIFHAQGALPAGQRGGEKVQFLYAGRLVPYKLPELPLRAFAASDVLRQHHLHVVGDGPELARMQEVIASEGLQECVTLHGRKTQAEVAQMMRQTDAFVFPSIRELGAGVVIEAMACGQYALVANYGAPGDLAAEGRGARVDMATFDVMTAGFVREMEGCVANRAGMAQTAAKGQSYAEANYPWSVKGAKTLDVYKALLNKAPLPDCGY
ncbi:glycosyltransferase family 4 protein [Tropicibacter naphthalenivorans]|uniref:UDP-D-galactose:(Glucosyl)lipopolysaccharide-1, 6-D-galactosyltransferase n=1 Tax=Tropicibacter naphthalenivorans TaxID=441103 RepID=A0A0P1GDL4_9RHOB|nr:glycosyltransferase family 4 protein [Tropicibacter naphthalenivorans]CUH79395.1 UDP-D-galactose:(glucosyl)lipopolysaccharide-1, 6-D-galactosyltransferase [Tropicibacter naphthalenivorans]SMC71892.1 Glycosyltransferase involved in cell wall bisynthesis [Tropicibacter naphthalenivorans]